MPHGTQNSLLTTHNFLSVRIRSETAIIAAVTVASVTAGIARSIAFNIKLHVVFTSTGGGSRVVHHTHGAIGTETDVYFADVAYGTILGVGGAGAVEAEVEGTQAVPLYFITGFEGGFGQTGGRLEDVYYVFAAHAAD